MLHSHTIRAALTAALLTVLALAPASAHAAKKTDWLYDVTVRAQMTEEWKFHEEAHSGDDVEPCDRYQDGEGSAKITLRSRRPTRVMVLRATGTRQQPILNAGTGEGIPLTGSYKRVGKDETRHAGPKCGPANPPHIQPTSGCGVKPMKADWTLVWKPQHRRTLHPMVIMDDLREDCPSGPPHGLDWENDVVPQIQEAVTTAAPSKFYGTKQFTLRGSRTFHGVVSPMDEPHFKRNGFAEVTWEWQTTYKLVSNKKRRRAARRR